MFRALVLATLLAGCTQLFGLEEGTVGDAPLATDAADPIDVPRTDAPLGRMVTGDYVHRYARNQDGLPSPVLESANFDAEPPTFTVMLEDGSTPPVTAAAGTFSFARPTDAEPYLVTVDEAGFETRYQHTSAALHAVRRTAGRLAPTVPRQPTPLTWSFTGSRVGFIATTGQWSHTNAPVTAPGTRLLRWDQAAQTGLTPLGELVASEGDTLWALETTSTGGYASVTHASSTRVTTTGQPVVVATPSALAIPPLCTLVESYNLGAQTRLEAVLPRPATSVLADYRVLAVPFPDALLNAGEVWMALASADMGRDDRVMVDYRPLFPGHAYLASALLQVLHDIALPGTNALVVSSQLRRFDRATDDCQAEAPDLASTIGIPTELTAGGQAIGRGAPPATVALPAGPIALGWSLTGGGADYVSIQIFELVGGGNTTTSRQIENIIAVRSPVWIPSDRFVPGRSYAAVFTAVRGVPGAMAGDFGPLEYPSELARIWANTFVAGDRQ